MSLAPCIAEIITLRAIALKPATAFVSAIEDLSRDHNATSYSTETLREPERARQGPAEIITLRAIALKLR